MKSFNNDLTFTGPSHSLCIPDIINQRWQPCFVYILTSLLKLPPPSYCTAVTGNLQSHTNIYRGYLHFESHLHHHQRFTNHSDETLLIVTKTHAQYTIV